MPKPAGISLLSAGIHEAEFVFLSYFIPAEGFEYELRTSGAAGSGGITGLAQLVRFSASSLELEKSDEGTADCYTSDRSVPLRIYLHGQLNSNSKRNAAALPHHEGFNTTSIPSWNSEIVSLQSGSKLSFVTSGIRSATTKVLGGLLQFVFEKKASNGGSEERLISAPLSTIRG